ncbi:ATP-binding protein [Phosphitispora sp. TUW77]|uniref:ATP-binding protein n=1 Tax=Phosphitispora sp. TUW77 TaxID=3152361 RepID=UPI003AB782BD
MTNEKKAVINETLCDHSPFCAAKKVCEFGAITQKTQGLFNAEVPEIDRDTCVGCGKCVDYCPHGAIQMK